MRPAPLVLLMISVFYTASAETPSPPSCVEGSTTSQDCNECICVDGGLACTRRFCLTTAFVETVTTCKMPPLLGNQTQGCQSPVNLWTYQFDEQRCVQIAYGGCNGSRNLFEDEETCQSTCGLLGLHIDTRIAVLPTATSTTSPECTEGTISKRACNTCVCIYGRHVCTRNLCTPSDTSDYEDRCLLPPVASTIHKCKSLGFGWIYKRELRDCIQIKFQCWASESVFKEKETCRSACRHLGLRQEN